MLRCTHSCEQGVDLATIEGRFILGDGDDTRRFLLHLVKNGSGKLVLSLAQTTYLDSFGLATLVQVQKSMRNRNGSVVLAAIPPVLQALMELTRIHCLFEIFKCQNAAINNLSAVSPGAVSDVPAQKPVVREEEVSIRDEQEPQSHGKSQTVSKDSWQRTRQFKIKRSRTAKELTDSALSTLVNTA